MPGVLEAESVADDVACGGVSGPRDCFGDVETIELEPLR
jgi:hypothetical protein